jgi:hypothetical protein
MVIYNGRFVGMIINFEVYSGYGEIDGEWVNCSHYDYKTNKFWPCGRSFNLTHCHGVALVCPD